MADPVLLTEADKGKVRAKRRRGGFADPAVRAKAAAARAAKTKEAAPKRKLPSKAVLQSYLSLVLKGLAGTEPFPYAAPDTVGLTEEQAAVAREQAAVAYEAQNRVLETLRSWCPVPDRLQEFEVAMLSDVMAEELIKRPRMLEPFAAFFERATDARFAMVILALAIPRMVTHGALPGFVGQLLYPAVLMATGRRSARPPVSEPPTVEQNIPTSEQSGDGPVERPMQPGMSSARHDDEVTERVVPRIEVDVMDDFPGSRPG